MTKNHPRAAETDAESGTLEDLRRRERELADFIENASVGLHWVGADGTILWANQAELDLLGYTREEYIGRHIAEFHADPEVIEDILRRLTNKETLLNYEARLRCKDGTIRHVLINSNVLWEGDRFVHTRCFTRDITERKRDEEALREADQRAVGEYERLLARINQLAQTFGTARDLATIFRALREFALISVPGTGVFISLYDPANQTRTPVYVWSEGEEVDVSALPPMPMSDSPHSRAVSTGEVIITDDFQAAMAGKPVFNLGLERDPRLPQSSLAVPMVVMGRIVGAVEVQSTEPAAYRPEHVTAMQMAANLAGIAVENVRLFERESKARAEAEEAERRSAFLAEASIVLASSLDYETTLSGVARLAVPQIADWCSVDVLDEDGAIRRLAVAHVDPAKVEWARELERRYPQEPDAPHGVPNVLRTGNSELYSEIPDSLLVESARDEEHLRILRGVGFASAMVVPLVARGHVLGAITFVTSESGRRYGASDLAFAEDLARRAALAVDNARLYGKAQESNRLKDEFLATLSHELRTPLTAILGWSRMMTTSQLDAENTARALESIERNARAQVTLIDDILDVSRIITGKLRLDVRPVDLVPVVEEAVESVRPAAEAKGIRLQRVLDTGPHVVSGDADRLRQVAWNLLANAVKFTPKGGRVQVRLERAGSHVEIVVSDTGTGIAREVLPHVFERFRQADSSTTREYGGLGLGLAIVRHLVELHGGTVRAESEGAGRGATFTVELPLMIARTSQVTASRDVEREHPTAGGEEDLKCPPELEGLHVLFVDDDEDARALLTAILESCGARVTAVGSASEALDEFKGNKFDVMISDIGMPEEDGYSLIKKIRKLPPERGGRTPAAALTAYARAKDRMRVLRAGYQMHVPKPVEPAELVAVVANLAGRHEED